MPDRSDLMRRANEARQQAEQEADQRQRERLMRMAESYQRLADSQSWSEAHPVNVGSLSDVFTKGFEK